LDLIFLYNDFQLRGTLQLLDGLLGHKTGD